jgi:hypothetical protein
VTIPTTKAEFKEFCLRKLGKPVIEVNIDDDQLDDRVDESIRYFWDYHFDGSEKTYFKYQISANGMYGMVSEVEIGSGGSGYANGASLVFTTTDSSGAGANATISTNANGTITGITFTNHGTSPYRCDPTVTVAGGTGAVLRGFNGGYIKMPENIIGAVRIFSPFDPSLRSDDMFSIRYQIALNDLYSLTSYSMVPYYMQMQQLALITEILQGQKPIRYNRHMNRLYVDMKWSTLAVGEYLVVEAYKVVDPEIYTDAWADRWLQEYTTNKVKQQWGTNLKKFTGMQLPGGVQFNGQQIYDEATAKLEVLMFSSIILNLVVSSDSSRISSSSRSASMGRICFTSSAQLPLSIR